MWRCYQNVYERGILWVIFRLIILLKRGLRLILCLIWIPNWRNFPELGSGRWWLLWELFHSKNISNLEEVSKIWHSKIGKKHITNSYQSLREVSTCSEQQQSLIDYKTLFHKQFVTLSAQVRFIFNLEIKVWMLTGDKMETAENIAKSCNLFQKTFTILKFRPRDKDHHIG